MIHVIQVRLKQGLERACNSINSLQTLNLRPLKTFISPIQQLHTYQHTLDSKQTPNFLTHQLLLPQINTLINRPRQINQPPRRQPKPMHLLHLPQSNRLPQLPYRNHLVREIIPIPIFISVIELGIPQPILFQWRIAGIPCPRGLGFADMRDAGVWCSAVEPDSLYAGAEVVFAELVVLAAGDDLGHVGVLHWEDYIGVGGLQACAGHGRRCGGCMVASKLKRGREE